MAAVRKSRRGTRKASRKRSRRGRRQQRGGATVTIYFKMDGSTVTNVLSSNPLFNVEGTTTPGQVKLTGTSTAKITGLTVNALGEGATKWDAATPGGTLGSMNTVVSGTTKFYAGKAASTIGVMGATGVVIKSPGLSVQTDNITLYNLLQVSSWKIGMTSTTKVSTVGALPPGSGTTQVNMRILLVTDP